MVQPYLSAPPVTPGHVPRHQTRFIGLSECGNRPGDFGRLSSSDWVRIAASHQSPPDRLRKIPLGGLSIAIRTLNLGDHLRLKLRLLTSQSVGISPAISASRGTLTMIFSCRSLFFSFYHDRRIDKYLTLVLHIEADVCHRGRLTNDSSD